MNKVARIFIIFITFCLLIGSLVLGVYSIIELNKLETNICVNAEKVPAKIKEISGGYLFVSKDEKEIYGISQHLTLHELDENLEINIDTVTREYIDNDMCYIYNENTNELFNAESNHHSESIKIVDLYQYKEIDELMTACYEQLFIAVFGLIMSTLALLALFEKKIEIKTPNIPYYSGTLNLNKGEHK